MRSTVRQCERTEGTARAKTATTLAAERGGTTATTATRRARPQPSQEDSQDCLGGQRKAEGLPREKQLQEDFDRVALRPI